MFLILYSDFFKPHLIKLNFFILYQFGFQVFHHHFVDDYQLQLVGAVKVIQAVLPLLKYCRYIDIKKRKKQ